MSPFIKIYNLLEYLPAKDYTLAAGFMASRDFYALYELVSSSIVILTKKSRLENSIEDTLYNMGKLRLLEFEIKEYLTKIDPTWDKEGGGSIEDDEEEY